MFNKIIIIGLGLIGGSLAMAIRKNNLSKTILAYNKSDYALDFALKNKIIDAKFNFDQNLTKDDLIIIATPLFAYEEIFQKIKSQNYQSLITDIGSVKKYPEDLYFKIFQEKNHFIPSHPIAGKESRGIKNSEVELFLNKRVILTKFCQNKENIEKIKDFWQKIGSKISILDPKEHDKIFCLISHLPQHISFKFKEERPNDLPDFLKKHLRIENSNPAMWQEIFTLNKDNLNKYYNIFEENYEKLQKISEKKLKIIAKQLNLNNFEQMTISNQEFFNQRLKIIIAFLQIEDVLKYSEFAGSGFKDFTSVFSS